MRTSVIAYERPALTRYTSDMHNERTRIEVFSHVPDHGMRTFALGPMTLIAMRCGARSIRRDAADVRLRPNNILTFIHQVRGHSTFSHYGMRIALEEGDFTLCNNSTCYDLMLHDAADLILFRVPAPMVGAAIPSPDQLCGRLLPHDESLASLAAAMARDLCSGNLEHFSPKTCERAGRHLLDVLANAYTDVLIDQRPVSAIMSGRFFNVKLFIEENLNNPELNIGFIARNLKLSGRYLRMIFAVSGESPSSYVLRRRLEECAAQLRDPRWRQRSITSVAFGWGFNSAPHFARSFRARFGCSPREYRCANLIDER